MEGMKIAVIGGGSTYTPELIDGLLTSDLAVREVALVDPDATRLEVVGGLAARMTAAAGQPFALTRHAERATALDGADAVIIQLRVGGQAARILDERIPLSFGLVGQETTGPGGFAKALRTIPVVLEIDREMAARCPGAWLINFTNPSGLITEALQRYGGGRHVGLCNYPLTLTMRAAAALGVEADRLSLDYFGLNHLSWARVRVDGADVTERLIEIMIADDAHRDLCGFAFAPETLRGLGLIPSGYLRYYYETERMVREMREAPQTRGERVRDVEAELLAAYADPNLRDKPAGLLERGGAWYSTAAVRLIHDLRQGTGRTHVLNVRNDGAVPVLPPDVVVETPVRVSASRLEIQKVLQERDGRLYVGDHAVPASVCTLMHRVKTYEVLVARAAAERCRAAALAALEAHPLLDGRHADIPALLDALLEAHRGYLPGW